jgi:hypothetical protein
MATDIKPADVEPADVAAAVTVTPGAARVPMTGVVDGTEDFLGVRHRDYSEDDVTDKEQKKERNQKRRKTTNILDRDNIPNQNVLLPLPSLFPSYMINSYASLVVGTIMRSENYSRWALPAP